MIFNILFFPNLHQDFTWKPQLSTRIRNEFDKKTETQYMHHMNEWKQKWIKQEEKPKDLEQDV